MASCYIWSLPASIYFRVGSFVYWKLFLLSFLPFPCCSSPISMPHLYLTNPIFILSLPLPHLTPHSLLTIPLHLPPLCLFIPQPSPASPLPLPLCNPFLVSKFSTSLRCYVKTDILFLFFIFHLKDANIVIIYYAVCLFYSHIIFLSSV